MLTDHLFSVYDAGHGNLPRLLHSLLEQQRVSWPQFTRGWDALRSVKSRDVSPPNYTAVLQFNPGRIVSSGAKVDDASIRARKCFLCVDNLPPEQKGILYIDEYLILCNPAPIFPSHFTIAHVEHRPQEIRSSLLALLGLAKDMGPKYTSFYNGPKCGASAPDHLHFQAAPANSIPVEREAGRAERRKQMAALGATTVSLLENLGREAVVVEGLDASMITEVIHRFLDSLEAVSESPDEAMVNILVTYTNNGWRLIIFPRRKHRPDVFYLEGDAKVLVSPAAVDMGGLIITPIERDFMTLSPELVDGIFREVSLSRETIVECLRGIL